MESAVVIHLTFLLECLTRSPNIGRFGGEPILPSVTSISLQTCLVSNQKSDKFNEYYC